MESGAFNIKVRDQTGMQGPCISISCSAVQIQKWAHDLTTSAKQETRYTSRSSPTHHSRKSLTVSSTAIAQAHRFWHASASNMLSGALQAAITYLASGAAYKKSQSVTDVRFMFDGSRVNPEQTPQELGMEDEDSIDAFIEQVSFHLRVWT